MKQKREVTKVRFLTCQHVRTSYFVVIRSQIGNSAARKEARDIKTAFNYFFDTLFLADRLLLTLSLRRRRKTFYQTSFLRFLRICWILMIV